MYKLIIKKPNIIEEFKFDNIETLEKVRDIINKELFSNIPILTLNATQNICSRKNRAKLIYIKYITIIKLKKTISFVDLSDG